MNNVHIRKSQPYETVSTWNILFFPVFWCLKLSEDWAMTLLGTILLFYRKKWKCFKRKMGTHSEVSQLEACLFCCVFPDCSFCLVFKWLYKNWEKASHYVPGSVFREGLAFLLGSRKALPVQEVQTLEGLQPTCKLGLVWGWQGLVFLWPDLLVCSEVINNEYNSLEDLYWFTVSIKERLIYDLSSSHSAMSF